MPEGKEELICVIMRTGGEIPETKIIADDTKEAKKVIKQLAETL